MADNTGSKQLNYSTRFDVSEILKNSELAIAAFKKVEKAAKGISDPSQVSSQKSITQAIADATKTNSEYVRTLDDERLKSIQLKNLKDQLRADALKDDAAIKKLTLSQKEYNIAKQRQADIDKEAARQAALRPPTQISNTQSEINAYNAGLVGTGATGALQELPDLSGIKEQLALVQEAKEKIISMNEAGTISTDVYSDSITKLTAKEGELIAVIKEYGAVQTNIAETTQLASVSIEEELGYIEGLKAALKDLNAQKFLADESNLPILNKEIQETEKSLAQAGNVGKEGFDEMGNKIKSASSATSGFISSLKSIAVYTGIAFAIGLVTEFIGKLYEVGKAADGIDDAFAKIGAPDLLNKLRAQTQGLISDLDLERLANKANKLNIPLNQLGDFLLFAARQAQDTGQSVDSLVDKIVDGIGRKSTRPFEQLGISTVDLQNEIKKTGDFTTALSNIISSRMDDAGTHIDNFNDKIDKGNTKLQNLIKSISSWAKQSLYPDTPADNIVARLTQQGLKSLGDLSKASDTQLNELVTKQSDAVNKLKKQYSDLKAAPLKYDLFGTQANSYRSASNTRDADNKANAERLQAAQNVLSKLKDQSSELENSRRITDNIVSLDEKRQQVTNLKNMAGEIAVGPGDTTSANALQRSQYLKDAQDIQDEIDQIDGKAQKKSDKTAANALKRQQAQDAESLKSKKELLEQISEVEDAYNRKSLSKNDEEIQAVNDRFKDLDNKVKAFNADPKNKNNQIDSSGLDPARQNAVATTIAKQQVDLTKQTIDEQKQVYKEYYDYQLKYGTDAANQAFTGQLKGFTDQVSFIRGQIKSLQGKKDPESVALLDLYNKELPAAQRDQQKEYFNETVSNLSRIVDATETSVSERKKIEDQYQKDALQLALSYYGKDAEARLRILKQNKDIALDQAKTLAFSQTQIAIDAATNLFNLTEAQLKAQIAKLKTELKTNDALPDGNSDKLAPAQRAQIEAQLQAAKTLENSANPTEKAFAGIADYADIAAQGFNSLASSIQDVNPGLADTLNALGQIADIAGKATTLIGSISSGNVSGIITGTIGLLVSVVTYFNRGKASAIASAKELAAYQDSILSKQVAYNIALRDQARAQQDINDLTLQELQTREKMLDVQKSQAQSDYSKLLAQESNPDYSYITGEHTEKYGGFLGIGKKTRVVQDTASIAGLTYDQLNQLDIENKLTGPTKDWFDQLSKSKDEIDAINESAADTKKQTDQLFTGTTADSIADSIIQGFKAGKRTMADFADDFKGLMQDAMLSTFENDYLKDKIAGFYKQFADLSEDADGLSQADEDALKAQYTNILAGGQAQIANIEKLTGSITNTTSSQNGISGATISKELTQATGDELAGLWRGQYDITKQMNKTIGDLYQVSASHLNVAMQIAAGVTRTADNTDALFNIDKNIQKLADNQGKGATTLAQGLRDSGIKI